MMRCKEVARLMTSDLVSSSSLIRRMELRLHLMMCKHCSRLMKQLKELRTAARRIAGQIDYELDQGTGKEMKARILSKLFQNHQNPPQSQ